MGNPYWTVKSVEVLPDYTLLLLFENGKKIYDASPLLKKPIYRELNNPTFFSKAHVSCGTVAWNDEIDIAPEHLYEAGTPFYGNPPR